MDIFAGESTTPAYRAKNPSGRTPVLELDSGETIAESNAILLYLGEGTPLVPQDLLERARVWQWLFFEQNLFEPNVGTARFWRLTGRDAERPEVFAARLESAQAALAVLDEGLRGREFLLGDRYTVADVSLHAYAHAGDAAIDMAGYPAVGEWLGRVERTPGFVNDLEPYPPNAARAREASRFTRGARELPRVRDGEALPVVVEVDKALGPPAPGAEAVRPGVELALRVVPAPAAAAVVEADVRPVGGELVSLEGPLGVVADNERGSALAGGSATG